jgi:hypothetical protein
VIRVIKSQAGRVENGRFKPVSQITDRAKRYRANAAAPPKHRCFACGNPRVRGVHHIDGREDNSRQKNLTWACNSCNVKIANTMRKAGLGKVTRQYNPRARSHGASSLGAYLSSVAIAKGEQPGNVTSAVRTIQATSDAKRTEYAKRIWEIRRERYGSTGRRDSLPF